MQITNNEGVSRDVQPGDRIAVRGYRPHCGKTQLALRLAEQLRIYGSVRVETVDRGIYAKGYNAYVAENLMSHAGDIEVTCAPDAMDIVIYDDSEVTDVDHIVYITPTPWNDPLLGIVDQAYLQFKEEVRSILITQCESIEFFSEAEATTKTPTQRDLSLTDWVVLRELERKFLKSSRIGKLRAYIRNTKPDTRKWGRADKL